MLNLNRTETSAVSSGIVERKHELLDIYVNLLSLATTSGNQDLIAKIENDIRTSIKDRYLTTEMGVQLLGDEAAQIQTSQD